MGNAASNEAQQQQQHAAANPLGRPRSHGGAVTSQPHTPGTHSLNRAWSRHGSVRRGASQTPIQNTIRNPFSRESSAGASTDRPWASSSASSPGGNTSGPGRRVRADSTSLVSQPPQKPDLLSSDASRERQRVGTSSLDSPLSKPAEDGASATVSLGLSSHLLRRPGSVRYADRQRSTELQDSGKANQPHIGDFESQEQGWHESLGPSANLSSAESALQAIVSPHHSATLATDAVAGRTNSGPAPSASPQPVPNISRPFGQGIAAIFASSSQYSAPTTASTSRANAPPERSGAGAGAGAVDASGRGPPAALPSYLKIPTLIPSKQEPAPALSAPTSPIVGGSSSGNVTPNSSGWSSVAGATGKATNAVLTTEAVIIAPGLASKVSSPSEESLPQTPIAEELNRGLLLSSGALEGSSYVTLESAGSAPGTSTTGINTGVADGSEATLEGTTSLSRTPTPTQKSHSAKALTPAHLERLEGSSQQQQDLMRKVHLETGLASGATTPVMPIPPGLTSAPPSAVTPTLFKSRRSDDQTTETHNVDPHATPQQRVRQGGTISSSNAEPSKSQTSPAAAPSRAPAHLTPYYWRNAQGPISLMPIALNWRGGGKEVFVTGTFANEWRSKILLKRSAGGGATSSSSGRGRASGVKEEHTVVLHLPPGTHRMKFIVDDRWRVSRELPTATDGDGNLVNYLEIPNVGPAHPGPLSAPGEEMMDDTARERERRTERVVERIKEAERAEKREARKHSGDRTRRRTSEVNEATVGTQATTDIEEETLAPQESDTSAHGELQREARRKAVLDLREEARKAELLRNGQLEEVFGVDDDALRAAENWVQAVPDVVLKAQEEDEAYRERLEAQGIDPDQHRGQSHQDDDDAPLIPPPPSLPRQLEKVILNSSPANPALAPPGGLVDDNSILPAPNHVVLNHLTASAIKGGVLAVGTTTRYKRKYVTTVFYRPVQT